MACKLLTVVGARPQFIKAAAVSRVLRETPGVCEILVHTGQHYDTEMSQVFFDELDIPRPDYNLGIGSGPHGRQTGQMLAALEEVLVQETPDWVLVYGDTNSTLAGAVAAAKLHHPVAHVEAGLRSFNRRMPEEINRVLTDHTSDALFAPTETAVRNLRSEGIPTKRISLVGDVMYDAALFCAERAQARSRILVDLGLTPKNYVLATIHRAENTDDPTRLQRLFEGLAKVATSVPVVAPLHPRTRLALERAGASENTSKGIRLIPPVGFLDMVILEKNAAAIATDSGGVQKEAFFYRVPCLTLREETEWVELLESGWNRLVPPTDPNIVNLLPQAVFDAEAPPEWLPLYGDGHSAEKIADNLAQGHPVGNITADD